jgi:precorrin-2 dehydrogenase/sirohydrochlorin ferrochelatase
MQKKNSLRSTASNADVVQKSNHSTSPPVLSVVYYPAFLNLENKKAVVIGGGKVAERKILSLLKAKADITVISPDITARIAREKQKGTIKHINRCYRSGDITSAFLVIAATDSPRLNKLVSDKASCLVNAVDMPSLCNFIVPSVIQRGLLTIAISTSGVSPALSRSIRKEVENIYGTEFSEYLKALQGIRAEAMNVIADQKQRGALLKSLASAGMIRLLREKGAKETRKKAKALLKESKNVSCRSIERMDKKID